MTREEAIQIIRKHIPHLGIGAAEMTEALKELIPELRESEKPKFKVGDKVIISNEQKGIITRISNGKVRVEMGDTMRIVDLSVLELSEKPMVQEGLEEEIREYMSNEDNNPFDWDWRDKRDCARHFAKWGAEHLVDAHKMLPKDLEEAVEKQIDEALFKWSYDDEDGIEQYVEDAFIAGAKWDRSKMMEKAVEGEVENGIYLSGMECSRIGLKLGDKVRVIVLKKEE